MRKLRLVLGYFLGIAGLSKSDIILASFPKAGNTWLKFIFSNYILLHDIKPKVLTFELSNNLVPELGVNNLLKPWRISALPRFVKTHRAFHKLFQKPTKVLLLLRNPRSLMVSYYQYAQASHNLHFSGSFSEFIRHPKMGLTGFVSHTNSWMARNATVLWYEDLLSNTQLVCEQTFKSLHLTVDKQKLKESIALSTIEAMQAIEAMNPAVHANRLSADYKFVRDGKRLKWQDLASAEDELFLDNLCNQLHPEVLSALKSRK